MSNPLEVAARASTPLETNPYVGVLAVFLGAGLATPNSRLLSVGLADLRGALGFSFDAASWLPTSLKMAMMFSGVFVVFVNAFWGPRRILLTMVAVFMVSSLVLPFARGYEAMLVLLVIAEVSVYESAKIRAIQRAGLSPGVGCARKGRVSKNCDGCTHPADVVRVAGSGA